MEEDPHSPEHEAMNVNIEPRITNRAHGGVRTDKTRFIRPVERQRMRPWLIDHLDQNDIPGLVWQERTEMIFRISWKHAANQCFNMQKDTNLFERWAIHTGRHQDSDHKRWKANFRCALNSLPDVTEMKEQGVKKGNNAFKVYRFLDEKEAKLSKDGKPRKKKEPPEYKDDNPYVKFKEGIVMTYDTGEGTSSESGAASGSSIPNLHQLTSGVDMLLEADSQEKVQPMSGIDNLQEILAAATASLAAGGDAVALEKISIEQLSRLGEVSKMKLDIRQSDRKRRKKEVSGILNVFLCNWCEKVFPTKVDLFQHFLIIHQDKLLSGEEYGVRKHSQPTEKLQQEIEDLEKKVLGFTQESYQNESEEVIEDGQVVDLSSNNSMTSQEIYIEDQVLDLSVAGALAKHPQPQPDVALDLSMSTSKQKTSQKSTSKIVQKRRRSNATDGDYTHKFGNYGLAGAPRTKRQLSLLLKRKEEEEEKARKHAEAQHSMEDLVHAEILISLKSGSKEENETETMDLENGTEKVKCEKEKSAIKVDKIGNGVKEKGEDDDTKMEDIKKEQNDKRTEEVEEEVASLEDVVYLELNDGSKVAISKQIEIPVVEPESSDEEVKSKNGIPVVVDSLVEDENFSVIHSDQDDSTGKPYKCALCPQKFEDPTELFTHVFIHKTEYKCSVCTKVMTDKDVYLNHIESHLPTGKPGQLCEVCNVHFSNVEELQKHIKSHESGIKLYKCGNCGKTYQTVKECVNCEVCLQSKGKEKQTERKDANVNVPFDIKVVVKDPGKVTGGIDETVNETGAAGANEDSVPVSETERKDCYKENIVNTGQKNLKGEPAINPVAGSENPTGVISSVMTGKDDYLQKKDNMQRKCTTQESFELPSDCLEYTSEKNSQKIVRNDVVDGENSKSIQGNLKRDSKVLCKKENVLEVMDKEILISDYMEDVQTNKNNKKYTVLKKGTLATGKVVKTGYSNEKFTTRKKLEKAIFQNEMKCSYFLKPFESEKDGKKHKKSQKETMEDKIKKNVFHCGICELKLHIDDVESHLKSHRSSKQCQSSNEEMSRKERTCVICKETIPVKSFYTHWKSHSVYDLSKAKDLHLTQRTKADTAGVEKSKKPFVCNLCNVNFTTFTDLKLHVVNHLRPRKSVDGSKTEIQKRKSDVLELSRKVSKDRGKKFKESEEKRITGKRLRGKKFRANSKVVKGKSEYVTTKKKVQDPENIKEKTSPTLTAALKTGPKFSLSTLTKQNDLQPSKSVPMNESTGTRVVHLDKNSVVVPKNGKDMTEEDKGEINVLKRKKTSQFKTISPKKRKSTNVNTLDCSKDKIVINSVDNDIKEININRVDGYTQKLESVDSVNVSSPAKGSAAILNDNVGTNAKPATLHRLQQKILLFKEGSENVASLVLSSVPTAVLTTHQELLATNRPVTGQTTNQVSEQVLQGNKSLVCAKNQKIPEVSVQVKDPSAEQELVMNTQSVGMPDLSSIRLSSAPKSVNSTVVLSASPQTYVVSVSSASPVSAVSRTPVAIPQSSMTYLPVSALNKSILQAHSSEAKSNVVGSIANLNPASQMVSLGESLQNLTRFTSSMTLLPYNVKKTMANVTSMNTVLTNISPGLNVSQQQKQLNITRPVIARLDQQSLVNRPAMSQVLITQRGLQQAVPHTAMFPFSNIIYAPHTSVNHTNDSLKTVDATKPTSYQLLLLPVSQPATQNISKTTPIVTEAVNKAQSFHNLSLENTVLGAKLKASNIQVLNQMRPGQSNNTIQSGKNFTTQYITSTTTVISSPNKASAMSSRPTLPISSDDVKIKSNKPTVQFVAEKSEKGTSLACNICKQSLNKVEEKSNHVCKVSLLSPSVKTAMSSLKEAKSGILSDSTGNKAILGQRFIRRISTCQATTVTASSLPLPLTLSTLPLSTKSVTVISSVSMTSPISSSKEPGVTSLVTDLHQQYVVAGSTPNDNCQSLVNSKQSMDSSRAHNKFGVNSTLQSAPLKPRVKEFFLKAKMNTENKSSSLEEGVIESEVVGDIDGTTKCINNSSTCSNDKDVVNKEENFLTLKGLSSSGQNLVRKMTSRAEQVITLYPCEICNKTFTLESLKKHAKKHMVEAEVADKGVVDDIIPVDIAEKNCTQEELPSSKEGSRKSDVYRCYFCFITYADEKTLSQHYTTTHPSMSDYLCPADNCAQIFFEVQECDMHYAFKHQHECRFCLQRFRTYVEFQAHIVQHYKNRTYRYFSCVKCRAQFSNRKAFYRHCRQGSNKCRNTYLERRVNCQQCLCCSINFTSKECLKLHFKIKFYHRVTFKCCICREVIGNDTEVLNHMSGHFSTCDYKQICFCHTCCIIFPYKTVLSHHLSSADHNRAETLHQHLLDKYSQVPKDDEIPEMQTCSIRKGINKDNQNIIKLKGQNRSYFKLEEESENPEDGNVCKSKHSQSLFNCEKCNACFKSLFRLKQHRVINHNRVQPERKRCADRIGIKKYLKRKGRKSIICEFCSKKFLHIIDLRKHINISHVERVYFACKNSDCMLNFNSIYEYEVHVCKSLPKGKDVTDISHTMVDAGQLSLKDMKEYMLQYDVEDCRELLDKLAGTVESVQEHLGDHFSCQYCDKRLHNCEQLKFHLINLHTDKLAQCVDCFEYFFQKSTLLDHRRECAVKGFSDEDFHTKKKLLGCHVCLNSFLYILGLAKYLRDLKFLSDKYKSSASKCFSRKGVFDLKFEGECGAENSMVPFYNSRKFVCISCKNEYCNAEDFFMCMKSRLTTERNKTNKEDTKTTPRDSSEGKDTGGLDDECLPLFGKAKIDLKNVFFCNECESIVCYQGDGICLASLKHPCSGSNTIL